MNASLLESSQILRVISTGRPFLSITSRANSHGRLLSLWSQFRDSSLVDQVHHSSTEGVVSSFATFDCFKASRLAVSDFLWHSLDALSQCPDLCRDVLRISITLPALELPLDYEVLSLLMSDIGALNVVLANVLSLAANLEVFRWDIPRLDGMVVFPERAIFTLRTISTLRHVTLSGINTPHITGLSPIGMIGLPLLERFAISDSGDTSFWYAYWLAFAPNIKQLEIQDELDHLSPQAWVTKSFDALSCIQGIECLALQCSPISFSRYAACLGAITERAWWRSLSSVSIELEGESTLLSTFICVLSQFPIRRLRLSAHNNYDEGKVTTPLQPGFIAALLARLPKLEELILDHTGDDQEDCEPLPGTIADWGNALKHGVALRYFTVPANFAIDEEDALYEEEEDPVVEAPPHPKPSPVPSTSAPSDHSLEESVYAPPAFQYYPKELRSQCTILRVFAEELMDRHLRNEEFREIGFLYFDVQECRRRILKYIQCIDTEEEPGEPMYIPFWRKSTVEEEETHLFWLSQGL